MRWNPDNKVWIILTRYFNIAWLSLLWLICSVPIVTIGASTVSMFTVLLRIVRDEEESSMTAQFFKVFKNEWKQATLAWLIVLGAMLIAGANIFACLTLKLPNGLAGLFWGIAGTEIVLIFAIASYLFVIEARFEVSIKQMFRNSVIFIVKNLGWTVLLLLLELLMIALAIAFSYMSIIAIGPIFYLMAIIYQKIFEPYIDTFKKSSLQSEALNV